MILFVKKVKGCSVGRTEGRAFNDKLVTRVVLQRGFTQHDLGWDFQDHSIFVHFVNRVVNGTPGSDCTFWDIPRSKDSTFPFEIGEWPQFQ